jgi:recombination protein RecR
MSVIDRLITALQVLPGIGPKSAQRMALYLLQRNREGGTSLSRVLEEAMLNVRQCDKCRNLTEQDLCTICRDPARDTSLLCIVESPADVLAFEQAGGFRGYYFVLHGKLSPLDGIGPEALGMDQLAVRIRDLCPEEVVLATNPTVEGEATAHYIAQSIKQPRDATNHVESTPKVSRIAHGVPLGGEIEYTDGGTLTHALQGRRDIN